MKKTAILYDFDKTLCTKDMQEYSLIPSLGYKEPKDFWKEVTQLAKEQKMDPIAAYLYLLKQKFDTQNHPLHERDFARVGSSIELYPGVDTWFERINAYGRRLGLEVEHYVLSSGMREIIQSSPIAKAFRHIYACRYYYDESGTAQWPAVIVNYTTKTQYIFRINKQVLDESDDEDLNTWIPFPKRAIPFSRMIYVGDGMTDVPCMRLVKEYGGKSVVVYNPEMKQPPQIARRLLQEGRADFMTAADYHAGGEMETLMRLILDRIGANVRLEEMEGR